jgi:UDP-2,3-diacylglucosamine hydrolase
MPHTLFISDLHLSADAPDSMAAFERFVRELTPQTEALYILGDLFEYWAGDDDLTDTFHQQVTTRLRNIADGGTKLYLMHGNRDLLMGPALAEACHATLLPDPTLIDLYGTPTLLSHGDTLCTDDEEYQRYRTSVHDAGFQQQFLAKPLAERKAFIAQLRARSQSEKQSKDSAIMDVNDQAVAALLREHNYPRLIHGHTHRPARHEHVIDGQICERWVLGDWYAQGNALRCDAHGMHWKMVA